ncbi:polysaccharide deacetylase family protein [Comamonas composti]|uniref:polysaccharide deacetylase family protein n=1 Tax=Comamonas composti TaxID=408558 RepID=UPI00041F37B0|nr:polysaccharide deacetylase family protein [Comamonas composti]
MDRRRLVRSATALAALGLVRGSLAAGSGGGPGAAQVRGCEQPLYLTFDTGHMGVADLIAQVLKRHGVQVTFFAANEATQQGDGCLGEYWAPWWQARAGEGHEFASHTWDHMYWRADLRARAGGPVTGFRVRPSAGPRANTSFAIDIAGYGEQITRAAQRLAQITGRKPLPLFRAPGGKTSPALLAAAREAGYAHVGWSPSGFLGDELPSESHPNDKLLRQALENIRSGDILLAHLGIWSRKSVWAQAVLEPLIVGLLDKGFCFRTLAQHPGYRDWIAQHRLS